MKREDLTKLGIEEDVVDKVMALHGKDVEAQKTALTTATAEIDGLKKQIDEANTAIEGFKKLDVDAIRAAADEWKTKAEQAETARVAEVKQLRFDHALDGALTGAKAKDVVAVRAHLKADLLKMADDGTISGLTEQLDKLKSERDYLFESETQNPRIVTGGNNQNVITDAVVSEARKAAGLPV